MFRFYDCSLKRLKLKSDKIKYNDEYYTFKNNTKTIDVVISNIFNLVTIDICNP